jgi:sarcosine oxidase, subunit delta
MLLIPCPWCGPRDEAEFTCGGEAYLVRPPIGCSNSEWAAYLFERKNPRGLTTERWHHSFGCGQWMNVSRNTVTHAISAVEPGSTA